MSTEMVGMQTLAERSYADAKTSELERFLSFGSFTVDLKREELFKDGTRINAAWEGLSDLDSAAGAPGEVVSREDLRGKLWPEGTHVNYDANVNTTVNKLRLALGDSPDRPIYVETIPRQGYSFVGAVSAATASAIVRNGNGNAAGMREHRFLRARKGLWSEWKLAYSSWFVAGVVALVVAGMYLALRQ